MEGEGTGFQLASMTVLRLTLRNPDFTTAQHVADAINACFPAAPRCRTRPIVAIRPPPGQDMVSFVGQVENLAVETDTPAKVIIDEVAGVVTMTDAVRISTVAIQQGNLTHHGFSDVFRSASRPPSPRAGPLPSSRRATSRWTRRRARSS